MSVTTTHSTVDDLLDAFAGAAPDQLYSGFQALTGALWADGALTDLAPAAVPALVAKLAEVGADRQAYLAILLGLLAEAGYPDAAPAYAAVRAGLDRYLELLGGADNDGPLSLALLYLLSHFVDDRDRILAVAQAKELGPDDLSRLDRALQQLDPADPDLGRVWPSPSVWALNASERDFDQAWIRDLTAEQIAANWVNDTRTVFGYSGAKAYWAVRNGAPVRQPTESVPAEAGQAGAAPTPASPTSALFGPHIGALRCPACGGGLAVDGETVRCAACSASYPVANGILDLSAGARERSLDPEDATNDLLQKLAEMPSMGVYYESVLRPAYLRIAGSNWGDEVTLADEDRYVVEQIRPTDGPVLDVAAGAGRWTEVVAQVVGADRLIALDMGLPMLNVLRGRLPGVPAVLGSALSLPVGDATMGAVNCWNALQAFPDDAAAAIAEIGRVLRPGGTFTMMTFRFSPDRIERHFQASHYFPSRPEGQLLFEPEEVRQWLADAGMRVVAESSPGTFLFVTAERVG